jgi:hypothetical protein
MKTKLFSYLPTANRRSKGKAKKTEISSISLDSARVPPPPTQLSDTRKKDQKSVECPLIQNLLFAPLF